MTIKLKPVDKDNWGELVDLSVAEDQKNWVAPNTHSIIEGLIEPGMMSRGIYDDNMPVGYTLYLVNTNKKWAYIARLMVDARHQAKGYGRQAMRLVIEDLKKQEGLERVLIGVVPPNTIARKFYEKLGFVDTGMMHDGDILMEMMLVENPGPLIIYND